MLRRDPKRTATNRVPNVWPVIGTGDYDRGIVIGAQSTNRMFAVMIRNPSATIPWPE
jgi:hypothetical protein